MPDFPSTQSILGDLVSMKSYDLEGERAAAEYIAQFARRWGLGNIQLVEYPHGAKGSELRPRPCNVVIDIGEGRDEIVVVHEHYDKTKPEDYPKGFERDPDQLIQDRDNPDIYYGDGCYDMLGSIAGCLTAAREMRVARHRTMRLLFVGMEEQQSQGTHAALHPSRDLVGNGSCLISHEIPVGATLDERAKLYIGRTGRVGLHLRVHGPRLHSGRVRRTMFGHTASHRDAITRLRLEHTIFPEHPNDPLRLMPESRCILGKVKSDDPSSLSIPSQYDDHIDVLYSHPGLTPADIHSIARAAIRDCLGDDNFTLSIEEGRILPFTKPWLEESNHPFVQNTLAIAQEAYECPVQLAAGDGVADEAIIVHAKHIPAVCFPPEGTDEHNRYERVRISSITKRIVPFLHKIAAFDGLLTKSKSS